MIDSSGRLLYSGPSLPGRAVDGWEVVSYLGRMFRQVLDRLMLSLFLGISGTVGIGVLFLLLYLIKSMIGIDLVPGWHLTDLLH